MFVLSPRLRYVCADSDPCGAVCCTLCTPLEKVQIRKEPARFETAVSNSWQWEYNALEDGCTTLRYDGEDFYGPRSPGESVGGSEIVALHVSSRPDPADPVQPGLFGEAIPI